MTMEPVPRERLLATTLLEIADTITDDFEALDLLQTLAGRTAELMAASSVGVLLADQRGELHLVASSSHQAGSLAVEALAARQGPCRDAFRSGRPMVNLGAEESARRWPDFTAFAARRGIRGAHALPLRIRTEVLGAVGLFFAEPVELSVEDRRVGEALIGVAAVGLLQERSDRQKELIAEQLQAALGQRVLIEQAKGIVAEQFLDTIDGAFDRMTAYARRTDTPLSKVAKGIVDRSLRREDLGDPGA